ncbi:MAG: DNA polymerase III subunit beta [Evtepia sp.]
MKFTCEKALLQSAILTASRAVPAKSSIPALEGILIEADLDLRLTGYNLETGIRTVVPADISETGSMILSARLFGEIVRKLPDDLISFSTNGFLVHIQCGMSEYNLMGTDPEDFPALPMVEYQNSFDIAEKTLRFMLSQTLFAVSDNESRPIHTGALFEIEENLFTLVAVDGFRLALRREAIESKGDYRFVVPAAALREVEKICRDLEEPASITMGARHVMFKINETILVARRLEGEFLSWRQAIPRNGSVHLTTDRRLLLAAIDRVSLIISDKLKSPLRCVFTEGEVRLSTKTAIGDASDCCPTEGVCEQLEIGFNDKYMMDALRAIPADRIQLELGNGVSPCVIVPAEGDESCIYIVIPVRLKSVENLKTNYWRIQLKKK